MTNKYLLFNLDDSKAKNLGETIASPTARKICSFLAEKEASEAEIAKELGLAMNTIEYNLKKLLEAGLIEKSKSFWSVKGKKIETYKVASKLIVISPKKTNVYSKLSGIVPVVLIAGIFTSFILWIERAGRTVQEKAFASADKALSAVGNAEIADNAGRLATGSFNPANYFLAAVWILIVIFIILSLRRK